MKRQKSKELILDFKSILPAETLDRTRQTESMVIAAILNHQQPDSDQLGIVKKAGVMPEDFSAPGLAKIYETMLRAQANDDFLTEVLRDAHYQDPENKNYLFKIFDEGSSIRNNSLWHHARALKLLSFERQEITAVTKIGATLQQGEVADQEYKNLDSVKRMKSDYLRGDPDFSIGLNDWWNAIAQKSADGYVDQKTIKSHLPSLDEQTQGFQRSEVSVLAGSPGSGKSALCLNFLLSAVNGSKVRTCLVSLEMSLNEILARLVNQISDRVPLRVILDPVRLQPKHWKHDPQELSRIKTELQKARKWTNRARDENVFNAVALDSFHPDVVLRSIESAARDGSEFIILDHVHRVQFNPKAGSFSEQMTNFMISMTEISKSQRCHIQVLSQLNRDSAREGRKPRLTDLKGSGGLEENTSLALFLVRDLDSNEASLNVQKARSGKSGWSIPLVFNPERLSFGETYF